MLLAGGLDSLAERERQIVAMRFEEGLTQSQIAARIGISQMHVSRLLRRALSQLRSSVGADAPRTPRPRNGSKVIIGEELRSGR